MRWILVVVTTLMIALAACTQSSTPVSVGSPGTYRLVSKSGDASCPARTVTVLPGRYETVRIAAV
jgi:hypothetical protein